MLTAHLGERGRHTLYEYIFVEIVVQYILNYRHTDCSLIMYVMNHEQEGWNLTKQHFVCLRGRDCINTISELCLSNVVFELKPLSNRSPLKYYRKITQMRGSGVYVYPVYKRNYTHHLVRQR